MSAAERDADVDLAAVAALEEPMRRRIYEFVVRRGRETGRDETAEALLIPRATAAFHLDRLVRNGLLDVSYQRLTGRSGPGAGRPAKLYHRSAREVSVSLPQRRYDFAAELLAAALEAAERRHMTPRAALSELARGQGERIGRQAAGNGLVRVLDEYGFEPRVDGERILLGNCPFHSLAAEHAELVCGMNLELLAGLVSTLGSTGVTARLAPTPGHCCVQLDGFEGD
ncbi:MAG: helix-turn-helix transcriptional regulator [Stackebrandtia sp.]